MTDHFSQTALSQLVLPEQRFEIPYMLYATQLIFANKMKTITQFN